MKVAIASILVTVFILPILIMNIIDKFNDKENEWYE